MNNESLKNLEFILFFGLESGVYPRCELTCFPVGGLESVVFFLYSSRECSTNQTFYTKQTQFFPVFHPKTTIPQKNKANTNPIQSQFWPKNQGAKPIQTQYKPKRTQTNPIMNQKSGGKANSNPNKPNVQEAKK